MRTKAVITMAVAMLAVLVATPSAASNTADAAAVVDSGGVFAAGSNAGRAKVLSRGLQIRMAMFR